VELKQLYLYECVYDANLIKLWIYIFDNPLNYEDYLNYPLLTKQLFYWDLSNYTLSNTTNYNNNNDWKPITGELKHFDQRWVNAMKNNSQIINARSYGYYDIIEYNGYRLAIGLYSGTAINFEIFKYYYINKIKPDIALQPFANVITDLCFIYNSWFQVKNFDELHIYPVNTGITELDIKPWRHYISSQAKEFSQEIKIYEHQDYHFKAVNNYGENAFGFDRDFEMLLNKTYKLNIVGELETIFKIYRVKNQPGITDLPDIEKNYQIKYGSIDLGLVKKIGYANNAKEYILTCRKYLTSMTFNDWWIL